MSPPQILVVSSAPELLQLTITDYAINVICLSIFDH